MTVQEIVKDYLEQNGYDGLCNENCGCGLGDFMPCEDCDIKNCKPAYKHGCDVECADFGDCELCEQRESYSTEKPEVQA